MSKFPPTTQAGDGGVQPSSMRIGPFWKRAADTPPSEEPFDALTDLFLGEIGPRPAAKTARREARSDTAEPTTPVDGPRLRLAGTDDDAGYALAPEPTAIARPTVFPAPHTTAPPLTTGQVQTRPAAPVLVMDREDEGEAMPVLAGVVPASRRPVLELVMLGNLPVMGSAWASQYVREIASAAGKPVAYLWLQGGFAGLELVGTLPEGVPAPGPEQLTSLDDAIDAAAEITDRWVVRCDRGSEGGVLGHRITRVLTLLTGAGQIAHEACRPILAGIAGMLEGLKDEPMVRVALMGATGEDASATSDLLGNVASDVMARPIPLVVCGAKLSASRPALGLFHGPTELAAGAIVASIERALTPDACGVVVEAKPEAAASIVPPAAPGMQELAEALESDVVEVMAEEAFAESAADDGFLAHDASVLSAAVEVPLPDPMPTTAEVAAGLAADVSPRIEPEPASVVAEPAAEATRVAAVAVAVEAVEAGSLCSHVEGLRALAARCPYAESVELAADESGALHVLARSAGDATDEATLAALLVVSSWAEAHAALLGTAEGLRLAGGGRPTVHLFTDRPKRSRRLLETNLRVHVLAEVRVGESVGWYCAELN